MKIMHFIHGLNTGGAETLVKNYMLNFDEEKNDYVLLCVGHHNESPYEEELKKAGVRVIYVEDKLRFKQDSRFGRFVNHFHRYFIIRKTIKREGPDIIHTHLTVNKFVKFARPRKNTVIFHTVHSEPKKLWSNKNKKDFESLSWLVKNYQVQFIVLHDMMKNEVDEMFGVSNSIVLNNGVDVDRFKNVKNREDMREELGIFQDVFVVGHVGRFSKVKNHDFLVEVFKELNMPNKFLLMVGDGKEKNKIEKKLNDLGFDGKYLILSNREDIPDLLNVMDVFVFPSFYEGMPTSLIEAQEAKIPCFSSDAICEDAVISNFVIRKSLEDRAKKWADVIKKYKKPEKIVINDEDWDIKKITKQLELMYVNAIKEKQNGKK